MRVIVAGSREGIPKGAVMHVLNETLDITEELIIVSGGARGVDRFGEEWAYENGVDVVKFPADWKKYGRSAGYRRNADMARFADGLFAFHNGVSKGTEHMINIMLDLKKPVQVFQVFPKESEDEDNDDE